MTAERPAALYITPGFSRPEALDELAKKAHLLGCFVKRLGPDDVELGEEPSLEYAQVEDFRLLAQQQGRDDKVSLVFGTQAWNAALQVDVDAHNTGVELPILFDAYPQEEGLWRRSHYSDFGTRLEVRSLAVYVRRVREEAEARQASDVAKTIAGMLPQRVGYTIFAFWEQFVQHHPVE